MGLLAWPGLHEPVSWETLLFDADGFHPRALAAIGEFDYVCQARPEGPPVSVKERTIFAEDQVQRVLRVVILQSRAQNVILL